MAGRLKITDVFTPRRADVNERMYINRPDYEKALLRSVDGSLHTLMSGESGCGKSWLWKKVAKDNDWCVFTANFGNAARNASIAAEVCNALIPHGNRALKEVSEAIDAKVKVIVAEGGGKAERKYAIHSPESIEFAFQAARKRSGSRTAILVLDNLEAIFNKTDLMSELGNLILLLDDERYAKHKVKLLIVGVPENVIEYFQTIENLEPVANRIHEIPHVRNLDKRQVADFLFRGFVEQLEIDIDDRELRDWNDHIYEATMGIPQQLHEYAEKLAFIVEDNSWEVPIRALEKADVEFIKSSLFQSYAIIEKCMNKRDTKAGRKNQVLFTLGHITHMNFSPSTVEEAMRESFNNSTDGIALSIGQILADLATPERPLLKRNSMGHTFRFTNPKFKMCLRLMLQKSDFDDSVSKIALTR